MEGELTIIPTGSLVEMLYVILTCKFAVSASDGIEIERIQRELQRRGEIQHWSFVTIH